MLRAFGLARLAIPAAGTFARLAVLAGLTASIFITGLPRQARCAAGRSLGS
jgi:hypothetical protein